MPAFILILGGVFVAYWVSGKVGPMVQPPGQPAQTPPQPQHTGSSTKRSLMKPGNPVSVFDGLIRWYGLDESGKKESKE